MTTAFEKPWGNYLLDELVETIPPDTISYFPQTIGWQVLSLIFLFWSSAKVYYQWKKYKANAYRREGIRVLSYFPTAFEQTALDQCRQLPALIRKIALIAFERDEVVSLNGAAWEVWLDKHCQQSRFNQQCANQLYQLAYSPQVNFSANEWQNLLKQTQIWIKHHRGKYD